MSVLVEMGKKARSAGRLISLATSDQKNAMLIRLADLLSSPPVEVLEANAEDIAQAERDRADPALVDRLRLNPQRLAGIAADLRSVAELPDPVGEIFEEEILPNGLRVHKQRVPIGVLGVIYESRPNVTIDVAGLAVKTGNAVILRGGSESLRSNRALVMLVHRALMENELPEEAVQFIDDPQRGLVMELLQMHESIDMLIPRGGAALHTFCRENSRIPVITGGIGICHLFVDASADQEAALEVIYNAKVQRPTVCNALDTTLVHAAIAEDFIPRLIEHLGPAGVSFRIDPSGIEVGLLKGGTVENSSSEFLPTRVSLAGPQDFDTEWLSLVLGIKVVADLDAAVAHIQAHSTGHSDGILTQDRANADRFIQLIDSAAVYVNASTRFTDGAQLGLGAEVAISTQRLQARGPMGLRELTTYKWVIQGDYHVRP